MKRSLCMLLSLFPAIFLGCGSISQQAAPVEPAVVQKLSPTEEVEISFEGGLALFLSGRSDRAYIVLDTGRERAKNDGVEIPEKFAALIEIVAHKEIERITRNLRVIYSRSDTKEAAKLTKAVMLILMKEGIEIPEIILRIHEKATRGRQELFHIGPDVTEASEPLKT